MDSLDIDLDHNRRLILVKVIGDIYQRDGEEIITTSRTIAAQHSYDVLYDVRQAIPKVSLARWFHLPRELDVFKDVKKRNVKAALLISAQANDGYAFYETVAQNIGLSVRTFFAEQEALAWLEEDL